MDEDKDPHPVDRVVGARVRSARVARGISQTALAERIGVTFQQVQKYENGSNRVSASKLVQIAETLDVPATSFLEGFGAQARMAPDQLELLSTPGAHDLLTCYRRAPPRVREAILNLARSLSDADQVAAS